MTGAARWTDDLTTALPLVAPLERRSVDVSAPLFLATVEARPEVAGGRVLLLGEPVRSALVARLEEVPQRLRLAVLTVARLRARVLTVPEGGVLAGPDDTRVLVEEALHQMDGGDVDGVTFARVPTGSPLESVLAEHAERRSAQWAPPTVHLELDTSRSYEETVAAHGKRQREAIRRARRKLASLGEHQQVVRYPQDSTDAATLLAEVETITGRSYQRGLGVGFVADEFHGALAHQGLGAGWFRAWVLHVDGSPAAYWTALVDDGCWNLHETAFDDRHADAAPGTGLLGHVVEEACGEPGVDRVSFGNGDARYKRDWADAEWHSTTVSFFSDRARWRWFATAQRLADRLESTLRGLLGEDRVQAVRRWVRARAAATARRGGGTQDGPAA